MSAERILVVEDNDLTRKVVRITLEKSGYLVYEAEAAEIALHLFRAHRPGLVLQDLHLPDMDGITLVRALRALPGGESVPILAFSGLLSKMEEARTLRAGFTDYLFKPIEPSRLLAMVEAHLRPATDRTTALAAGERILLVDDDAIQGKLNRLQLERAGYRVEYVGSGAAALEVARSRPPAVVVTDLLMADMTGLELCLAIRRDTRLERLPVVVTSASFSQLEDDDLRLADRIGANAFVIRTPEFSEALAAIATSLAQPSVRSPDPDAEGLHATFITRLHRQLEQQGRLNASLARQAAMSSALLSIMSGAAEILMREHELPTLLHDVLARALDAGGVSAGAIYLFDAEGSIALKSQIGFSSRSLRQVSDFYGHREFLEYLARGDHPVELPAADASADLANQILAAAETTSLVIAPLAAAGTSHGALLLRAGSRELGQEFLGSVAAVAAQLGQAVALSKAISDVKHSESRYRSLFEGIPGGVFRTTVDGTILDANSELAHLLHYPASEALIGKNAVDHYVNPADRGRWQAAVARQPELKEQVELQMRCRDGAVIWCSITARVIRDASGEVVAYEGTLSDITARKQLENQLHQSQKMEAIGQLAAGVAHDFNNMLTAISGFAELLREELDPTDPRREHIGEILGASQRAGALTRQLLAFGRRQVLHPLPVDLNQSVAAVQRMLVRLIGENITLRCVMAPELWLTTLDPGQVEQILLNLAVNSRDAMPGGGELQLATANVTVGAEEAAARGLSGPGRYVRLEVTDSGQGIPAAALPHIFEPFYTTKEQGKGTGLGLSTVHGIVHQSGGSIEVHSVEGRSTTFTLHFPVTEEIVHPVASQQPVGPVRGTGTVLLVEDEAAVRKFAAEVLARAGYRVLQAEHADGALALSRDTDAPIDLLVADMVMPGMSGSELAALLRGERPTIQLLFLSGYSTASTEAVRQQSDRQFLDKPFTATELLDRVSALLGRPA